MAKNNKQGSTSKIIGAALAGAAIGAATATLADKKKREQLRKKAFELKRRTDRAINNLRTTTEKKAMESKVKLKKNVRKAADKIEQM